MFSLTSKSKREKGQGLVEYAIILALVAIVVIGAMRVLGPTIGNTFSTINSSLPGGSAGTVQTFTKGGTATNSACSAKYSDGYATGIGYHTACYSPSQGAFNLP